MGREIDVNGLSIPEIIELIRKLADELELREMEKAGEGIQ